MTLGERLREAREENGWSLTDVAEKTGWHFSTIGGWERGVRKPDPDKLAALARLYDVSADVLLGLADHPIPSKQERRTTPDEQLATSIEQIRQACFITSPSAHLNMSTLDCAGV